MEMELIYEVKVRRELREEYGHSHNSDSKKKLYDKIFLLNRDGVIADDKGRVGAW
jgi:hypothetical protein